MIKKIIETHLPLIAIEKGKSDLGDRSSYIGASDIGQCPRKTIMSKIFPQEISIEQQIVFERGHLAENIVHESLINYCQLVGNIAGMQVKIVTAQVEVSYPENKNIKAHIDFVLRDIDKKTRTVIEVKTATMVSEPYDSWINQCIFQQGLLMLENPGVKVDGYVLVLDLKTGQIAEFKIEYDEFIFKNLIERAVYLLDLLNTQEIDFDAIPTKESVLCGYCPFQADCGAYQDKGDIPDDLQTLIKEYFKINANKKGLDKQIDALKEQITAYGPFKANVDGIKASYTVTQMMSLDIKALKQNEPELAEMYSTPKEFTRLTIS
jgi:CRISPR-associated exonuclease Cas4